MPICIKHKINFKEKCPECEKIKQTVTIKTTTANRTHMSDYILNLNIQIEKLKALNNKLNKLLKDNE